MTPDGTGRDGPTGDARAIVAEVAAAQRAADRTDDPLRVLGDVLVFLDDDTRAASDRRQRLDEVAGESLRSDARVFTGTVAELADLVQAWQADGLHGARLRPAVTAHDLPRITRGLVPELQHRGVFRTAYEDGNLRARFGLTRPADRYARS